MARRYWYAYNGASGGENILGNYTLVNNMFIPCSGGSVLCAIYAPAGGENPNVISANIKNYIMLAKASHSWYPSTGKPYVYTLAI